jgi:hypothetical protein
LRPSESLGLVAMLGEHQDLEIDGGEAGFNSGGALQFGEQVILIEIDDGLAELLCMLAAHVGRCAAEFADGDGKMRFGGIGNGGDGAWLR